MRNIFYICLVVLFISSCSKEEILQDNPINKTIEIKLNVREKEKNIFELITFNIYSRDGFTLLDLEESYDSIIWKVSDMAGQFKVYEHTFNSGRFSIQWSHNFFLPGTYKTILSGYKNDKVICSDTIPVTISNTKDFLGYNWKDITASGGNRTGYADVLSSDYGFSTYASLDKGVPSVTLSIQPDTAIDKPDFIQESKNILFDYISGLYASPTYKEGSGNALFEYYNTSFHLKEADAEPMSIWITPQSRIVLLKCNEELEGVSYKVYAEPNK